MTRQILIAIYILMVLALSGAVKASAISDSPEKIRTITGHGIIQNVSLDAATGVVSVHGILPTPCHTKPTLIVNKINQTHNVIELAVVTSVFDTACLQMLGDAFDAALDLKDLPLENEQVYSLVFENFDAHGQKNLQYTSHPHPEGFFQHNIDKQGLKGLLVYFSRQSSGQELKGYALTDGQNSVPLALSDIALEKFENKNVHISGYVVNNAVVPVAVSSR